MLKIYIAGPLFTLGEVNFNLQLEEELYQELEVDIFLPQNVISTNVSSIFNTDKEEIEKSEVMIAILDGVDVDSGTAWEIGYAFALRKRIIGIRTDFRTRGDDGDLNLMISQSCDMIIRSNDIDQIVNQISDYIYDIYTAGE